MALNLDRYRLFLVDMDDTLYEERDFVLSGFRAVAEYLGQRGGDQEKIWHYLHQRFSEHGRGRIFDHLFGYLLGDEVSDTEVSDCVSVYRKHQPCIALYPGVQEVLGVLRSRGRVIVVTDGLAEVQRRKYDALGLESMVDQLVCCWDYAPKPDPIALEGIVETSQADALLIGDHPAHDLALADTLGIDCVRVHSGRYSEVSSAPWAPIAEVSRFAALSTDFSFIA